MSFRSGHHDEVRRRLKARDRVECALTAVKSSFDKGQVGNDWGRETMQTVSKPSYTTRIGSSRDSPYGPHCPSLQA